MAELPGRRLHTATMIGDRVVVECRREGEPRLLVFPWADPAAIAEIRPNVPHGTLKLSRYGPLHEANVSIEVESYLDPSRVDVLDLVTYQRDTIWTRQVRLYPRSNFVSEQMNCSARDERPYQ